MIFYCKACKREVKCTEESQEMPWPWEYENLEGHFYALCRACAMFQMNRKLSFSKNPFEAKEIITHHFKALRARMISKGIEYLEAEGGLIYIGDTLGTVDPTISDGAGPLTKSRSKTEGGAGEAGQPESSQHEQSPGLRSESGTEEHEIGDGHSAKVETGE